MSLSVVIASFNRPESLQRAIDSALQQKTVEDIIVVDDASPTGTMPKAETGGKIRVERHRENRGCCAARNTGLNRVRTEYVAFLDNDDRLPSGAYEPLLDALARFRSRSDTPTVAVGSVLVEKGGRVIQRRKPPSSEPTQIWGLDAFLLSGPGQTFSCKQAAVFPTQLLRDIGGWNEALRSRSSTELFFRLCSRFAVVGIDHPTYLLNRDPHSHLTDDCEIRETSYRYLLNTYAHLLEEPARLQYFKKNHETMMNRKRLLLAADPA